MSETVETAREDASDGPSGIGGWLILPLLGLIVTLFLTAMNIFVGIMGGALDFTAMWLRGEILPEYVDLAWLIPLSIVLGLALLAFGIVCMMRFFQKHRSLPRLMIGFYAFLVVSALFDAIIFYIYPVLLEDPSNPITAFADVSRTALGVAIWSTYFCVSKRVRATFVN